MTAPSEHTILSRRAIARTSGPAPVGDGNILSLVNLVQNGAGAFLGATSRGPRFGIFQSGLLTAFQFLFTNFGLSTGNGGGPASITFGCSVETAADQSGVKYPLTFGGRLTATLDPEGYIWSDPINLDLTAGSFIWPRTYFTVPSTGSGFVYTFNSVSGFAEGWDFSGSAPVDNRGSGTITVNVNTSMWGPIACIALCGDRDRLPILGLLGDSIISATGETATGFAFWRGGWAMRGISSRVPILQSSHAGGTTSVEKFRPHTRTHFSLCDHVITATGVNDLDNTAATLQNDFVALWRSVRALGPQVWQTTITPKPSSSSDGWTTIGGQTADTVRNPKRVSVNAWIRAGSPIDSATLLPVAIGTNGALLAGSTGHPLAGYIEVSDLLESTRDSGLWIANYTSDGVHPNSTGHIAASVALADLSRFGII